MADQTDNLTFNDEKLDYEADEGDQGEEARVDTPNSSREEISSPRPALSKSPAPGEDDEGEIEDDDKDKDKDGELESGEELEDGEISDEDEALKNERNEPKAVCRFYNRGHCTWGTSCRFLHPGVLDKGNYNMFAAPRPILPGEPDNQDQPPEEEEREPPILMRPPPPAYETAWERGLRQAKEMRRRSHKRREMDVEYEEKKSNLSLTQIELDKENDYYTRPASPAHTHDPYADDDYAGDNYDNYYPETRRVAPPPPADFVARGERAAARRGYSASPPPRTRRVAPPRSPSPGGSARPEPAPPATVRNRFRGGEDWADPWMRSKEDKSKPVGGRSRRRSYSSGSSRSSSSRSSSSKSSIRRRRRYSSSPSSRSSSSSRSRSSTPEGIPRRSGHVLPPPVKNTAPLQKRLAAVTQQSKMSAGKNKHSTHNVVIKQEGEKKSSSSGTGEQSKVGQKTPRDPVKMSLPRNQVKMSLKTISGKPSNQEVLDKLGTRKDELPEDKRKRKLEQLPDHPESIKIRRLENEELMETLKQRLKSNLEAKQAKETESKSVKSKKISDVLAPDKRAAEKEKKKKGSAAAVASGAASASGAAPPPAAAVGDAKARRKEELLKQLKAVEDAIHRKRTKLEK